VNGNEVVAKVESGGSAGGLVLVGFGWTFFDGKWNGIK
jgi:hypothetical protein